ncbi:MAG: succinate dehydrogenase assembly factor 2 [Rhodocyclaceae bacterium]|nr:succinate dehydrogenase assembly factor 2 [Rhodocyclaceae bacterium]MBX3668012.1 succinate dehydrogenase assembly factor 2 [Rhodocyclaceae bacterium]
MQAEADALLKGRLRWRSRRGLLELDIAFQRFIERDFDALAPAELEALSRLLDYDDPELWAIVSGREECEEEDLLGLVELLRKV